MAPGLAETVGGARVVLAESLTPAEPPAAVVVGLAEFTVATVLEACLGRVPAELLDTVRVLSLTGDAIVLVSLEG